MQMQLHSTSCTHTRIVLIHHFHLLPLQVLKVQESCFKSDLMEFNVWEELMWMMQQQKLENMKGTHKDQRKFLGKVKQITPPPSAARPSTPPLARKGGLRSSVKGVFGGARISESSGVAGVKQAEDAESLSNATAASPMPDSVGGVGSRSQRRARISH